MGLACGKGCRLGKRAISCCTLSSAHGPTLPGPRLSLPACPQLAAPGLGRIKVTYRRIQCAPPTDLGVSVMDFAGANGWLRLNIDVSPCAGLSCIKRLLCLLAQPYCGASLLPCCIARQAHLRSCMLQSGSKAAAPVPCVQDTGGRGAITSVAVRSSNGGQWIPMTNSWGVSECSGSPAGAGPICAIWPAAQRGSRPMPAC